MAHMRARSPLSIITENRRFHPSFDLLLVCYKGEDWFRSHCQTCEIPQRNMLCVSGRWQILSDHQVPVHFTGSLYHWEEDSGLGGC